MKQILHFQSKIEIPPTSTLKNYERNHTSVNKKKNKHKFDKFTYYRINNEIVKVLFLDDDNYIDFGKYPFIEPVSKQILIFSQDMSVQRTCAKWSWETCYNGSCLYWALLIKVPGQNRNQAGNKKDDRHYIRQKYEGDINDRGWFLSN